MTRSARLVLILLGASLLAGAITGTPLYFRLSYLWAGLLVVSWLMSLLSLRGVRLRRTPRSLRSQVGHACGLRSVTARRCPARMARM